MIISLSLVLSATRFRLTVLCFWSSPSFNRKFIILAAPDLLPQAIGVQLERVAFTRVAAPLALADPSLVPFPLF